MMSGMVEGPETMENGHDRESDKAVPDSGEAMPMPGDDRQEEVVIEKPPTVGRQVVQLVAIPVIIVILCIGFAVLFTMLAGEADSIDTHLRRLRNPGGLYHDRTRAAAHLGQMILELKDPDQKAYVAKAIEEILNESVKPDEKELIASLMVAEAHLGQPGGLETILAQADSKHEIVRHAVGWAVASWPDVDEAEVAVPVLVKLLDDVEVKPAIEAARVLGIVGKGDDQTVVDGLKGAMEQMGIERREVRWNAAVALARLGDEQGGQFVAEVLLNRSALAGMASIASAGDGRGDKLSEQTQTQIMMSTLVAVMDVKQEEVTARIKQIAENDPEIGLRNAAKQVLDRNGNN